MQNFSAFFYRPYEVDLAKYQKNIIKLPINTRKKFFLVFFNIDSSYSYAFLVPVHPLLEGLDKLLLGDGHGDPVPPDLEALLVQVLAQLDLGEEKIGGRATSRL